MWFASSRARSGHSVKKAFNSAVSSIRWSDASTSSRAETSRRATAWAISTTVDGSSDTIAPIVPATQDHASPRKPELLQ